MNARGAGITTPNPRAEPPSAVKNVEESRQQRLQRAQSRFRDRGGIFVPTNRSTLIDILLGKKDASPKRSRRSRSRSASPQKPPASPTLGKGKRVSFSSSAAIATGEISTSQAGLRRSPRKKPTAAPSKSSTSRHSMDASKKKVQGHDTEDEAPIPVHTKPRKGKHVAQASAAGKHTEKATLGSKRKAKEPVKRRGKNKGTKESGASTSRLSSQALDSDVDDIPPPSKAQTKKQNPKTTSKSSKSKRATVYDGEDDDDIPLAADKSRTQATKRKLSIVQEEEEEDTSEVKLAKGTSHASSSPPPPPPLPRKRPKVAPPSERSPSPPPVKKSGLEARAPGSRKAKAATAVKKSLILSDDEDDIEPPLPKATQKKPRALEDEVPARPHKRAVKGKAKAKAPVETDVEDEVEPYPAKLHKGKGKAVSKDEAGDDMPLPAKKPTMGNQKSTAGSADPAPPKGSTKSRTVKEDLSAHDRTMEPKSKGAVKATKRGGYPEHSEQEAAPPKQSRSKTGVTTQSSLGDKSPPTPAKSKRKRPADLPDEDEHTPTKRVKTLPLQDVDEQSPPSKRKGGNGRKPSSKAKPVSKTDSRKLKENTPTSDCSEGKPARQTRSRSKPPLKISGPRKSVMVRMLEPLPPMEDNDPDPIDFLS